MKYMVFLFNLFLSTTLFAQDSNSELLNKIDPRLLPLINNNYSNFFLIMNMKISSLLDTNGKSVQESKKHA